jgi:hypothetical protein
MSDGDLGPYAEQQLANLSAEDFDALVARVRPPVEPIDPMERAAQALRNMRGVDRRGSTTKEQAAAAMREYANGSRNS